MTDFSLVTGVVSYLHQNIGYNGMFYDTKRIIRVKSLFNGSTLSSDSLDSAKS